jgi:hypothetical protein
LRSRLCPQVPEKSIEAQIQRPREVFAAAVSFPPVRKQRSLCQAHERVSPVFAGYQRPNRRNAMTATLQRMVRDPRTGEVHMPHEPLSIIRTVENLGRTLVKIKWQAGGESVLLPDDLDSYDDG